jgi:hypothetical protein
LILVMILQTPSSSWGYPDANDLNDLLNFLRNASSSTVCAAIKSRLLMLGPSREAIEGAYAKLTDVSRDAWDPSVFSDPNVERGLQDDYCYIIHGMRPTIVQLTESRTIEYLKIIVHNMFGETRTKEMRCCTA